VTLNAVPVVKGEKSGELCAQLILASKRLLRFQDKYITCNLDWQVYASHLWHKVNHVGINLFQRAVAGCFSWQLFCISQAMAGLYQAGTPQRALSTIYACGFIS
jgi:hypothetical protein